MTSVSSVIKLRGSFKEENQEKLDPEEKKKGKKRVA